MLKDPGFSSMRVTFWGLSRSLIKSLYSGLLIFRINILLFILTISQNIWEYHIKVLLDNLKTNPISINNIKSYNKTNDTAGTIKSLFYTF